MSNAWSIADILILQKHSDFSSGDLGEGDTTGSLEAKRRREERMDFGEGGWGWTQHTERMISFGEKEGHMFL